MIKKLARVMRYLRSTLDMSLTLEADNPADHQVVGGRIIRSTPGYEEPHWRSHDIGQGCHLRHINLTETQYTEFN